MMTERNLNESIYTYFKKRENEVYSEIPFLSRIIDLIVVKNDEVFSYELKLKNWQKAIEQLKDQRIGTTYSILCMPNENISNNQRRKIIKQLKFYGFGFNLWDQKEQELIEIIRPRKNTIANKLGLNKLIMNLKQYQ